MDFSNSCAIRAHKIFDPSLALHCIGRGGSDKGDLRPSLVANYNNGERNQIYISITAIVT